MWCSIRLEVPIYQTRAPLRRTHPGRAIAVWRGMPITTRGDDVLYSDGDD